MNLICKHILFLFVLLFFILKIDAQNNKIDSLKNELKTHTKNDTTKVNLLYQLAFMSFRRDLKSTKLYLRKVEDLSNDLNYTKGKAKVSYLKGILENRKSNFQKSLLFFKRSLKYYESIQDKKGVSAVYNAFGITHFDLSQYKEAIHSYKKALEIDTDIGNEIGVITSLINIGNAYSEIGRYTEAVSNYKEALIKSELINDEEGISFVYSNLAVVYKAQGNYLMAIDYFNKGLDYDKKIGDTLSIANKFNNLGVSYEAIEKHNKALEYHKKSLNLSQQKENKHLIAVNNSNIGNIYMNKKEYAKALKYYHASLETSQKINNLKQVSTSFHNIGYINLLLNKPLIARENFIKTKDINLKINHQYGLSFNLLGISKTYLYEKQYQKALSYALKGQKIAKELDILDAQKKAKHLLYSIYKLTKDYKKALENHEQYKSLNDSIFNKKNIEKITQLEYEYKYKNELASAEKRELRLTKTVKTTSQSLKKSQRNLLLGVIAFLVTGLILGAIIFFLKLRNEKAKTQNIVIEQKLLRSQMTPHFIFNSLSVLQGMILNEEKKKSVSYVSKFSKLLRIILENSRDKTVLLSQELAAIENYLVLQNLENEAYVYTITVEDTIDTSLIRIPPMLMQPFVENAIEHAFVNQEKDRKIDVQLTYSNKELICIITDNGIGITTLMKRKNQHKKSLSTTITSERLLMLSKDFKMKGSVTVEDRKKYDEQGTKVTLVIPYEKQKA